LKKKRILLISDWFFPGFRAGGPIRSTYNMCVALKDEFEISVVTSIKDHGETLPYYGIKPNVWNNDIITGVSVFYLDRTTFTIRQYINLVCTNKYDFVYLNHLYSPFYVILPLLLKWRNNIQGKIILCPRGALHSGALAEKKFKKILFIKTIRFLKWHKFIHFHATNEKEAKEIEKYFPGSEITIAGNFPGNIPSATTEIFKKKGELNLIYIARIAKIKNLLFVLEALENIKGSVKFTIIGPVEDEQYFNSCKKYAETLPANINIEFKGPLSPNEIDKQLSQNHLYVLATNGENFGHSIFEALKNHRPILISDRTPWRNLHENSAGWDLSLNHPEKFSHALQTALNWDDNEFKNFCDGAASFAEKFISSLNLKEEYKKVFA